MYTSRSSRRLSRYSLPVMGRTSDLTAAACGALTVDPPMTRTPPVPIGWISSPSRCDGFDLDEKFLLYEAIHDHERIRRAFSVWIQFLEQFATRVHKLRDIGRAHQVRIELDHVAEGERFRFESFRQIRKDLSRLPDQIVATHQFAMPIHRDLPRDKHKFGAADSADVAVESKRTSQGFGVRDFHGAFRLIRHTDLTLRAGVCAASTRRFFPGCKLRSTSGTKIRSAGASRSG